MKSLVKRYFFHKKKKIDSCVNDTAILVCYSQYLLFQIKLRSIIFNQNSHNPQSIKTLKYRKCLYKTLMQNHCTGIQGILFN